MSAQKYVVDSDSGGQVSIHLRLTIIQFQLPLDYESAGREHMLVG